jgi:hypothetical protein
MRCVGHVAQIWEKNAYKTIAGKLEGKNPLGSPRHRWEILMLLLALIP